MLYRRLTGLLAPSRCRTVRERLGGRGSGALLVRALWQYSSPPEEYPSGVAMPVGCLPTRSLATWSGLPPTGGKSGLGGLEIHRARQRVLVSQRDPVAFRVQRLKSFALTGSATLRYQAAVDGVRRLGTIRNRESRWQHLHRTYRPKRPRSLAVRGRVLKHLVCLSLPGADVRFPWSRQCTGFPQMSPGHFEGADTRLSYLKTLLVTAYKIPRDKSLTL
jgi:hypothetical protein